jgi:hypothetical protein
MNASTTDKPIDPIALDLTGPEFDPPDCPAWAREQLPAAMLPYRGRNGMPDIYRTRTHPLGREVVGIDRYHANQFLMVRPETLEFLYRDYTPTTVTYRPGLLPRYERLAEEITAGCATTLEQALALLTRGVTRVRHPYMPPCGPNVPANRGASDDELLRSAAGWCNEQARVFIRLCQVRGIPARFVHQFYSDHTTGHCVAEFYADGRWCMADASWFCVFPGDDGRLLSAAQCHDRGAGQQAAGRAYRGRFDELLARPVSELNFPQPEHYDGWRRHWADLSATQLAAKLGYCAIINYPLPQAPMGGAAPCTGDVHTCPSDR